MKNHTSTFQVTADRVTQESFTACALSSTEIYSDYLSFGNKSWKLSTDISHYPQFTSDQLLVDALYNMSLEELILNIEEDGTFRTGADWEGVWTRDISYSAILSLAMLHPEISKTSLRKKVGNGRIIQDTGTGGAYPISTDRVVWAIAAWEIYLVTGEQAWLEEIYPIIKKTLSDDIYNAFNPKTGLVKGESSFLDWREQSYPEWMQPADIYESETLGTSAVHFKAHELLAEMAKHLGYHEDQEKHSRYANKIKAGINDNLWLADKGYYSQFLYGRNFKIASTRSEALGAALTVLFDIADKDRQEEVIANTPVINFGIPSIFPQIPNIPPYHNDGIWPFVQAYWSLAAAKTGNEAALTQSLDALYRAAALFVTNKENFVAHSGDYEGTQINSDRQLWSVAGNLGMVYKVFFGMDFQPDKLVLNPMVPEKYKGYKKISNFKYRNALLEIDIEGHGNQIKSATLDGEAIQEAVIPSELQGKHHLKIKLIPSSPSNHQINLVANAFSPASPKVNYKNGNLSWEQDAGVKEYLVLRNGEVFKLTTDTSVALNEVAYGEYQVIAKSEQGLESFASEPLPLSSRSAQEVDFAKLFSSPLTEFAGFSGKGYIPTNVSENNELGFDLVVKESGVYAMTIVYSNGHGAINTDNKSALRSLTLNEQHVGTFVFPQRGKENWEEWGVSNPVHLSLEAGKYNFCISLEDHNQNMNIEINEAMLDQVRLIRID